MNNEVDKSLPGYFNHPEDRSLNENFFWNEEVQDVEDTDFSDDSDIEDTNIREAEQFGLKEDDGDKSNTHSYTSYWYSYPEKPSRCQTCYATRTHISLFEWRFNYPQIILTFGLGLLASGMGLMLHRVFEAKSIENGYSPRCNSFCLFDNLCIEHEDGTFQCQCKPGFAGERCQYHRPCEIHDVCKNGGECIDLQVPYKSIETKMYECKCPATYSGDNCQNQDSCLSLPCQNGGTCKTLVFDYKCFCTEKYHGKNCEKDYCNPTPCLHGGACTRMTNGYKCTCLDGYNGQNCEIDINECSTRPCLHGGTCLDLVNAYECKCASGWTGVNCTTNINECDSSPCENGATCVDQVNAYKCTCVSGWTGDNCETDRRGRIGLFSKSGDYVRCSTFFGCSDDCSGRLEWRLAEVGEEWNNVCDDSFEAAEGGDDSDVVPSKENRQNLAKVVCRELGCSSGTAHGKAKYGQGHFESGEVWMDDVKCTGSENTIFECEHRNPLGRHNCGHSEDVSVECN